MEAPQPNAITEVQPMDRETKQLYDQERKNELKKGRDAENVENVETITGTRNLRKGYCILGANAPKNYRILYFVWAFTVHMLATVIFPAGFLFSYLNMADKEWEIGNFLTSLQAGINDFAAATKMVVMTFMLPKLLSSDAVLKRLDSRCHTKEELEIIKRSIKLNNRTVLIFFAVYFCYTSSTCISGLIFNRLPFNLYNPLFDSKASTSQYYMAFIVENVLVNLAIGQQAVNDSYPVIYVNIIRTHLDILAKRIKNLNSDPAKSLEANIDDLKMCITDHKNILEIHNIVAPIISITIFIQFTVTATILCVILINIFIFAADFASIVASCIYVCAVTIEIFPLSYCAQCLMDESSRLQDVLFHSNWVDQDVRYRKMLIFFIQRSQRTLEFTAGKLFPITLSNFLSIAKFSFTLYTFIKQMGVKEKLAD